MTGVNTIFDYLVVAYFLGTLYISAGHFYSLDLSA